MLKETIYCGKMGEGKSKQSVLNLLNALVDCINTSVQEVDCPHCSDNKETKYELTEEVETVKFTEYIGTITENGVEFDYSVINSEINREYLKTVLSGLKPLPIHEGFLTPVHVVTIVNDSHYDLLHLGVEETAVLNNNMFIVRESN